MKNSFKFVHKVVVSQNNSKDKPNYVSNYVPFICVSFQAKPLNAPVLPIPCLLPSCFVFRDVLHVCLLGFFGPSYLLLISKEISYVCFSESQTQGQHDNISKTGNNIILFVFILLFTCFLLFNRKQISCFWALHVRQLSQTERALGKTSNSITS